MNSDEKFFSRIGFNYLIFAISGIIIQLIAANLIGLVDANLLNDFDATTIIMAICNYAIPLPILIFLMRKIETRKLEQHALTAKTFLTYFAITVSLMWLGNIIGLTITSLISAITPVDVSNPVEYLIESSNIWINLLLVSIIGPVFEEFIFRKLLIDRSIKYGMKLSIILSAIVFGLFHGNLSQFFYASLLGGFFAYVYIKTGRIIYPILLHISINIMGSVVSTFIQGCWESIASGTIMSLDFVIFLSYLFIMAVSLLIGLVKIIDFKKSKLDYIKPYITLARPYKTMFLNPGIILFVGFFIVLIMRQIFA